MADRKVIDAIVTIGKRRGESTKRILAALETGKVESNFQNLNYGDADSKGWRQERSSLYKDPTNLEASINRFYDETAKFDNASIDSAELAARVQRPAAQYRGRYREVKGDVIGLLKGAGNNSGAPSGGTPGVTIPSVTAKGTAGSTVNITEPVVDQAGFEKARKRSVLGAFIAKSHPGSFLLRSGLLSTEAPSLADFTTQKTTKVKIPGIPDTTIAGATLPGVKGTSSSSGAGLRGGKGKVQITGPNPGRIQGKVKDFAARIADISGSTIVGSDGTGHSKMTTTGNVSEHWTGAAMDIPAAGDRLVQIGQAALIAAGKDPKWARKQRAGLFNVVTGGKRYQIIFGTNDPKLGGDHTDHLHIGVRG